MLHYVEPTLKTGYYDTAIVHVGVNDLINDKSPNNTENLTSNLINIVKKCKSFGVKNVPGIAFNKRLPYPFIKKANEKIEDKFKNYETIFIDNGNISDMDLYPDGLHLLERGKCLLARKLFMC